MTEQYLSIGAFAKRAGLSVRTLQYYDRINLLKPSAYSEAGRRLYHPRDFAQLQQIITLKLIGLSLDEIKLLLTQSGDLHIMLQQQKRALVEKVQQFQHIIQMIEAAQQATDMQGLVDIIQEINMSNHTDWLGQFLSSTQQAAIAGREQSLAEQKQTALEIKQLLEEADGSPEWMTRWQAFIKQYARGDSALQAGIQAAYANLASMPADESVREWIVTHMNVADEQS